MFAYQGYHAGICIDIFPIDYWDSDKGEKVYEDVKKLNLENSTFMRMKNPNLDEENRKRVASWSGMDPVKVYDRIQSLVMQFPEDKADSIASSVSTVWKYGKDVYPKDAFDAQKMVPFENTSLPIPGGADGILKSLYGDYMTFPPVEKRGAWHSGAIIDPDYPYSVLLNSK